MFRFRSLKTKLVTMGIGLTLIPIFVILMVLMVLMVLVVRQDGTNRTTSRECRALADETLDQIAQGVYLVCETQDQVLQEDVNKGLVVTKSVMNDMGAVSFDHQTVAWDAVNQYTKTSTKVHLPRMLVGATWPAAAPRPPARPPR